MPLVQKMSDDEVRIKVERCDSPLPDENNESPSESLNPKLPRKKENDARSISLSLTAIKSTPINGISWPSSAWEDGSRRSAFHPYKPTVLTNLQRGNIKANNTQNAPLGNEVSWFENAGRGNIDGRNLIKKQVNELDQDGLSALMWSSAYGQTPLVQKLIKVGANVNVKGKSNETALHLASAGGHNDVIKVLLANGANVNDVDQDGNTPLLFAVYGDHPYAVDELLNGGADLLMSNHEGIKPYSLAVRANCNEGKVFLIAVPNWLSGRPSTKSCLVQKKSNTRIVLENYLLDRLEDKFQPL